jgi:hypothetical protein
MNRTASAPRRTRRIALLSGAAFALAVAGGGVAAAGDAGTSGTQTKPAPPAAGTTQFLGSYSRVVGPTVTLPAGGFSSSSVSCPAGQRAFGGGESNSAFGTMVLTDSWPISTTSWLVWVKNNGGASGTYHAYVICGS